MIADAINTLESKSFSKRRKVSKPCIKLSHKKIEALLKRPCEDFLDPRFLLRAGLQRDEGALGQFAERMKLLCVLYRYKTVEDLEKKCNPYELVQLPGIGETMIATLFDLFAAFDLTFHNMEKVSIVVGGKGRGDELADLLGLPKVS